MVPAQYRPNMNGENAFQCGVYVGMYSKWAGIAQSV
jgi:hypothetical protein